MVPFFQLLVHLFVDSCIPYSYFQYLYHQSINSVELTLFSLHQLCELLVITIAPVVFISIVNSIYLTLYSVVTSFSKYLHIWSVGQRIQISSEI